jgi:hypothetical protein
LSVNGPGVDAGDAALSRAPFRLSARAAGAARAHIRIQFVGESVLLAGLGGIGGAILGGAVTARLRRHT